MSGEKKAKAIYAYQGERQSDLSFAAGDIINVVSETSPSGPEWWEGELNGRRGAFPLNHVEIMMGKKGKKSKNEVAQDGINAPKIGKPKKPELFQYDHIIWKVALIFSVIASLSMLLALIMPWYFITFPNINIREFQFVGRKNYQQAELNNPRAVLISTNGDYNAYNAVTEPGTKQLHLQTLIMLLVAFFIQFPITILLFFRMRGYLKTVFFLPLFSLIAFILILIAPANYANKITNLIATEQIQIVGQDPDSNGGPRVSFFGTRVTKQYVVAGTIFGNAGTQTWGPTASWAFAVVAILPAFVCYLTLFLAVLGRRFHCIGYKLKGASN